MSDRAVLYAEISKVEEQDDGTIKVFGIASSEATDSDGEIILADAIRDAAPDYLKWGTIREMHQPIAAGTAISLEVGDDGITRLGAHVVDPGTVKKVQTKVLKGFSVRGPILKRRTGQPNVIEKMRLTEISLVDRPANPEAVFELVKFDNEGRVVGDTDKRARKFSSDDMQAAKTLLAAARKKQAEKAAGSNAGADEARKGLYDVQRLAGLVESLAWLQQCAEAEAQQEGDNSPIPAKLKAQAIELGATLVEMTGEEVGELFEDDDDEPVMEVSMAAKASSADGASASQQQEHDEAAKAAAQKATDDAKAAADEASKKGAKFSKSTLEQMGTVHKAMSDHADSLAAVHKSATGMMDAMKALMGGGDEEDDSAKAAKGAEDDKTATAGAAPADDLASKAAKLEGENADLRKKLDEAEKRATTLEGEYKTLAAGVEELTSRAGAKGSLRMVVIGKEEDVGQGTLEKKDGGGEATKGAGTSADPSTSARSLITSLHKAGAQLRASTPVAS